MGKLLCRLTRELAPNQTVRSWSPCWSVRARAARVLLLRSRQGTVARRALRFATSSRSRGRRCRARMKKKRPKLPTGCSFGAEATAFAPGPSAGRPSWSRDGLSHLDPEERPSACSRVIPPHMHKSLLDRLPVNYDDTTRQTIEQIDVMWLKGRSMARAFEIEHTTAVYSGLLADGRPARASPKHGHPPPHRRTG